MTNWTAATPSQAALLRAPGEPIGEHRRNYFVDPTPEDGEVLVPVYTSLFGQSTFCTSFTVIAHIYDPSVRYRQYVKGKYAYDGVPQPHELKGGYLTPGQFLEDSNGNGTYGDRAKNVPGLSFYRLSTDKAGLHFDKFMANDTPGDFLQCPAGTVVVIDLTFRGELVDAYNRVCARRQWRVFGSCKTPGGAAPKLIIRS